MTLAADIISGSRIALARGITLIESALEKDRQEAKSLIQQCLPHAGNSIRTGITGVPGVGKSTFIEHFGNLLCDRGHRVAVLAVDPSGHFSGGSILGDKTRMETLSVRSDAYIRPSASGGALGGVTRSTSEAIVLCEAAGYDRILIETVGVGQSESAVNGMVDYFLLLLLPGAGDELQGIKRGIMELAHGIAMNKSDIYPSRAEQAAGDVQNALHYLRPVEPGWTAEVFLCSAITGQGIEQVLNVIETFATFLKSHGRWNGHRQAQNLSSFRKAVEDMFQRQFEQLPGLSTAKVELEQAVKEGRLSPYAASDALMEQLKGNFGL